MAFQMPSVTINTLQLYQKILINPLIQNGQLVECPRYNCNLYSKLLHHFLLKHLYHDTRFCVPVQGTWHMPHINKRLDEKLLSEIEQEAKFIINKGCFQ